MSNRIWLLIAGVAVAIAIAVSAVIVINQAEPSSQAADPALAKPSITSLPSVLIKKITGKSSEWETPVK